MTLHGRGGMAFHFAIDWEDASTADEIVLKVADVRMPGGFDATVEYIKREAQGPAIVINVPPAEVAIHV